MLDTQLQSKVVLAESIVLRRCCVLSHLERPACSLVLRCVLVVALTEPTNIVKLLRLVKWRQPQNHTRTHNLAGELDTQACHCTLIA